MISIDNLTEKSVSVKIEDIREIDGVNYILGEPSRKAYVNSENGRNEVVKDLPDNIQDAIFAIWGESPIVEETPFE